MTEAGRNPDSVAALLATLETARRDWDEPSARQSAQRVAGHAIALGLIDNSWVPGDDVASVDALAALLRAAVADAAGAATILIVEDDRLTAQVLSDAITAHGRAIQVAPTAARARALIREHDIALIVLDLVLPDNDGRDLLTEIRATPATRATPVIVVTARTDAISQAECYALGADVLLPKPVDTGVLLSAVSAQLAHAAERRLEGRIDGLTMLPNRAAFMDALERATTLAHRNQQNLAAAMIDLDHFKSVNDTYGHAMGDRVLHGCAQTISRALRTTDFVARWGGEELCVFFPDTSVTGAVRALDKALAAVRGLQFKSGTSVFGITFSAGLAPLLRGAAASDMLEEADRLLYVAKNSGRNRIISPADEADPPRPRALVVEDDPAVNAVVVRLLQREGFDIASFADGRLAAEAAEGEHFSLAIIDLHIPVMNGFELVEKLRTMPTASKMPILFLTGSGDEDNVVRGFEVGANDYLVKPFYPRELIARISRLLPKR